MSMESILEPNGYTIIKANSGRQALKVLLSDIDFALILMDVKMPNLNGFETATLIYEREKLRHIPIIFITAEVTQYIFPIIKNVPRVALVKKPFNLDDFSSLIEQFLRDYPVE